MRERIWRDVARGHFLKSIIPDCGRSPQGRFYVTFFEQAALLGGMRPYSRKAVGLQFELDGGRVGALPGALFRPPLDT